MKFTSLAKRLGALSITLALGAGMVACSGGDGAVGGGGGAVAATVNGQDIMEQTITDYVADFRQSASLESDEAWGQWLVSNGYTPETVRQEVIDYYVDQDLYEQAAAEYNVAVEQADIDEALEQTKNMFESEEAFQQALEASNMTEESYVETVIKPNLLQTRLSEAVANATAEGTGDEAMLQQAQEMADSWNGAKKSSHILFNEEEEDQAKQVLDQIKKGEIAFEDAAKQYSKDTGSAQDGGNVGWDKLTSFVTEYQDALNGLDVDQMTELVKTEYGYHIIKCTDVFNLPEGGITSLDQLPAEFQQYLSYLQQTNATSNFSTWFAEYRDKAEITINPMPEGLPYAIDLAPYKTQAEGDQAAADQAANAGQAAAEADQAAADQAAAEADQAAADQQTAEGDVDAAGADQAAADGDQAAADQAADQAAADQAAAAADQAADQAAADQAAAEADQAAAEADQAAADQQPAEGDQAAADQQPAEGDQAQ